MSRLHTMVRSPRPAAGAHSTGFTLLELLLAVALTGLILAVVAASFSSTQEATMRVEERAELEQMGRMALDVFVREIQATYLDRPADPTEPRRYRFIGTDDQSRGARRDSLLFVTLAPRGVLTAGVPTGLAEIQWSLDIPSDSEVGFLMHREDPLPDKDIETGGIAFDLAERVRELNFRYLVTSGESGEWLDSWDSETNDPPLPNAVEITITFEGLRGEFRTVSTVAKVEVSP